VGSRLNIATPFGVEKKLEWLPEGKKNFEDFDSIRSKPFFLRI